MPHNAQSLLRPPLVLLRNSLTSGIVHIGSRCSISEKTSHLPKLLGNLVAISSQSFPSFLLRTGWNFEVKVMTGQGRLTISKTVVRSCVFLLRSSNWASFPPSLILFSPASWCSLSEVYSVILGAFPPPPRLVGPIIFFQVFSVPELQVTLIIYRERSRCHRLFHRRRAGLASCGTKKSKRRGLGEEKNTMMLFFSSVFFRVTGVSSLRRYRSRCTWSEGT